MKGVNKLSTKEMYILRRRRKKIRLRQLAEFIGCSQSLISRYETENCAMEKEKIRKYKEFIDSF
jgi:transcriptional regulator with XRE-family HTH domain